MKKEIDIPSVGYDLKADWYEGASTDEIIFMLIGYSSNKGRYGDLTEALVDKTGASALVLDYSGHGESPFDLDDLTPAQNLLDVITTFDWIAQEYSNSRINIVSCSYGGYLSALLAKYRNFNKLVMRVPAIYKESDFYSKWKNYDHEEGKLFRNDELCFFK
jgi:esterase/lipase